MLSLKDSVVLYLLSGARKGKNNYLYNELCAGKQDESHFQDKI